jgi:hypothetical protein
MKGAANLLYAVLSIPIILLISLTVFQNFFSSSQTTFEQVIVNESLGTGPGTYYTAYPAKVGSATVYNGTTVCSACSVDYKSGLDPAVVTVPTSAGSTAIKITYTAYAKEGYSSYVKTYRGTQTGFSLGSLLPFVLIAITIVGIIIAALRG